MIRRFVPGAFWVGTLACALLLLAGTMRAANPSPSLPNVQGVWDGLFLADDGTTGLVQSDITAQDFRRLTGNGVLLDLEGNARFNAWNFNATLAGPQFLTGTGVARPGRVEFQADLGPFAGLGGDAVMAPEYHFVPSQNRVSALLLHPASGGATPDIADSYAGRFASLPDPITGAPADPTFMGAVTMQISPRTSRGYFTGRVELFLDANEAPFLSWPFLVTTRGDRRVIGISQGKFGRFIYDGALIPVEDASPRLDGFVRLLLNDGRSLFNTYNLTVFSQ
jgi:hypothetical protein